VPDLPKPMAPVGGKPFLSYVLQWLDKYNINRIIISTGYKSDAIVSYFGNSFNGIQLEYALEEKPLGTGGAVRFSLHKTSGNEILILNGDTFFPIGLDKFYSFHTESGSHFSVALKKMKNFSRYGSVECKGDTITKFHEKNLCAEGLINGGIYLAGKKFLESGSYPEVFSLEKVILEKEAGSGKLKGQVFDDPFIDIGIPEDYRTAQSLFKIRP
ncbi:MAG: sugar phosphate nucleotidyltransferase, partial [Bacteroidia bacterium]|nr:sugar phosphate nucleotidyltransferase [Bacteroidia bacterium]